MYHVWMCRVGHSLRALGICCVLGEGNTPLLFILLLVPTPPIVAPTSLLKQHKIPISTLTPPPRTLRNKPQNLRCKINILSIIHPSEYKPMFESAFLSCFYFLTHFEAENSLRLFISPSSNQPPWKKAHQKSILDRYKLMGLIIGI